MSLSETQELVNRAVSGDEDATAQLCELKARQVYYLAASLMGNRQDAEDAAQEVLIRVFRGITRLRRPQYFELWLYRVALNVCNTQRKRNMTKNKASHITDGQMEMIREERVEFLPAEFAESDEKRRTVLRVVEGLRANYKKAVLLHYYEGLSRAQAAHVMGVSVMVLDNYLKRARAKIRQELEKSGTLGLEGETFAMAPVPVLTQTMQWHAERVISRDELAQLVSQARTRARLEKPAGARKAPYPALRAAIAVAAAAAVGVCALLPDGANPLERPLSSSAMVAADTPQPSEALPITEEGLEIDQTDLPMVADPAPQTGSAAVGEDGGAAPFFAVHGAIRMKGKDGIAQGAERYIEGVTLTLLDADGAVAAQTKADGEGNYSFGRAAGPGWAVRIETAGTQLLPAEENPGGVRALGPWGDATLYVRKTFDPQVEILFSGGDCACGHVNPKKAWTACADELDKAKSWEITDGAGRVAARGDTAMVERQLRGLPEGEYTLAWTIRDIAGNEAVAKRVFQVSREPVPEEEYA